MINYNELAAVIERIAQNIASDQDLHIYNFWCNSLQNDSKEPPLNLDDIQIELLRKLNLQINKSD